MLESELESDLLRSIELLSSESEKREKVFKEVVRELVGLVRTQAEEASSFRQELAYFEQVNSALSERIEQQAKQVVDLSNLTKSLSSQVSSLSGNLSRYSSSVSRLTELLDSSSTE